jgi:hypothetical protein
VKLYVACTRARRILLVGSDGNGPSNLISDMGIDTISSSELLKVRPRIVAPKAITSKDVLRLSHGEVFAYLDCPKRYELEHQHEFKGITTSALRLGGALHRAIENAHRWQIIGDLSHFDDDKLIEIFKQTWPFPIREETDSKQYKKYEALYLNYFKDPSSLKRETISVENDLTVIRGENILTGKLDVAQRGSHDETVIVEIKLSYNRANQKRAENQLNVYALAFPDRDLALEAVYLKGQRGTQRHKVKQGDCKELAEQVEFAFGKVRGKEFKADPEGEKCRQCRMSKICHEGKEIITKKAA